MEQRTRFGSVLVGTNRNIANASSGPPKPHTSREMTVTRPPRGMMTTVGKRHWWAVPLSLIALVVAAGFFVAVADEVVGRNPLTLFDVRASDWFHSHATPGLTAWMLVVTHLHGPVAISTYVVIVAAFLAWKREWYWLTCLIVTVPTGLALNTVAKSVVHRARPSFDDAALALSSYSFPSGHVMGATLFYGVLAAMLVARTGDWRRRALVGIAALALVALVAVSRVYLLVHYVSDVVAAFAEALAWLTLCLIGIHACREYRARQAARRRRMP